MTVSCNVKHVTSKLVKEDEIIKQWSLCWLIYPGPVFPTDSMAAAFSPPYLCKGRLDYITKWAQFDHDSSEVDYAILVKRMYVLVLHHTVKTTIVTHEMLIFDPQGWWCWQCSPVMPEKAEQSYMCVCIFWEAQRLRSLCQRVLKLTRRWF